LGKGDGGKGKETCAKTKPSPRERRKQRGGTDTGTVNLPFETIRGTDERKIGPSLAQVGSKKWGSKKKGGEGKRKKKSGQKSDKAGGNKDTKG